MGATKVPIEVELDDGTTLVAVVDQRDYARTEAAEIDPVRMKHTWMRHLAFCAVIRTGQYKGTWERFNEVECVEVVERPAPAGDADDPGLTDRGAGS
jgi:hypothetical protein